MIGTLRRGASACGVVATLVAISAGAQATSEAVHTRDPLVGRLVPTFAWTSMDDSTAIISPPSLRGSFVLIDLWGTWCGPCRRDMPFLHEAYARFRGQGLEIVSVAFDVSPEKVTAYRRNHFPMPWQHVYATSVIEAEATRIFRVDSFPRTLLLDRDGKVLRVDTGLRGPALAATLDSVFAGRVPPPR
jgi:thiol-disulfide isomerase/thioredoxin